MKVTYMRAGIFTTTIEKIISFGDASRHFRLRFPEGTEFDFRAGQFVNFMLELPDQEKIIKRPYSIASPPCWHGTLDFIWKRIEGGLVTNYLWNLKEGDSLKIQGPLGMFTTKTPLPETIVFISTGTGIAPFRAMAHELLENKATCKIWNIFGARYEDQILYRDEWEALAAKHPNFRNVFTVSRSKNWQGETQYVQFMLKKFIAPGPNTHIYICGLSAMIQEVRKMAEEMGFKKDRVFFEKYD